MPEQSMRTRETSLAARASCVSRTWLGLGLGLGLGWVRVVRVRVRVRVRVVRIRVRARVRVVRVRVNESELRLAHLARPSPAAPRRMGRHAAAAAASCGARGGLRRLVG